MSPLPKQETLRLAPYDLGRLNMAKLALLRDGLQQPVRSAITLKGYAHDWQLFNVWCEKAGRVAMPASSDSLALYVTWMLVECGRRVNTAARHVSAIEHHHRLAGHVSPVTLEVKAVLASVRRQRREKPKSKTALTPEDLLRVSGACNAAKNAGARDRALLVLGFATALRRSDLARLELADISFAEQGLLVVVRYSKTDQMGRGRILSVWAGQNPLTDPVAVVQAWVARRGVWAGPLFSRVELFDHVKRRALSGEAVNDAVKRAITRAGMDASSYGAHSLRAGAITAAALNGGTDREIMRLSGHTNVTVMQGYIRVARVFAGRNPLAGVL